MKKVLLLCAILAGAFTFSGYGDDSTQTEKVAITGFGGYTLGSKLNPEVINQQMREKGYVRCKAKAQFRNFEKVVLFFTPKTFIIYEIVSDSKGRSSGEMAIIKASFEKKYKEKMESLFGFGDKYSITRGDRKILIEESPLNIRIRVFDENLEKQKEKETEEIAKEQVDTTGL